ncbi:uncharacterized protein LOC108912997 [Anoplophora glabripennis]|uniref:uncharacterized protein LOC108912997 n=1 Tax=Anoplophora glabripennis TaxID=217634 RepID=UPI000873AA33|nr:uncharacterized protein LOC108912997 [Anoplophora glabripennis]
MKAQVTSILLCALLCSTLGHEYLSAKRLAPEAKSGYRSGLAHFQDRAASSEQCEWICEGGDDGGNSTGGLKIIVNETTSLVGIVNITAEVALIIDINANLVGLFNGTSGAVVIINIQTGVGVYIAAGQCSKLWISSKESFEVFFRSLTSLQVFIDQKVGTTFKVSSASSVIVEVIAQLLIKLSSRIATEIQGNDKVSITILVKITTSIITSLRGSLKGILKLFGHGLISLHGDLIWLANVFEGLALFVSKITGGLTALIKAGVQLDIALLLRATNGLEILINLLLAIVVRVDLSIVAGILNSVEVLIQVIVKLGGDVSTGVTGVWKIIYQIISLRNNSIKIDVLIATLIEYAVEERSSVDLSIYIKGLLEVIRIQESRHSSTSVKAFITFVQNLQKGKLVIGGIDISGIITILLKGAVGGVLLLVITILLRLTVIVKAVESILSILLYLLRLLNSRAGLHILQQIIPGLSIKVSASGNFNIFVEIFRSVNVLTITRLIASGFDLNVVLTSVPVLGQIYKAVSSAVSSASNGSLSLKVIIKSSGSASFVTEIRSWFKEAFSSSQHGGGVIRVTSKPVTSYYTQRWTWHFGIGK